MLTKAVVRKTGLIVVISTLRAGSVNIGMFASRGRLKIVDCILCHAKGSRVVGIQADGPTTNKMGRGELTYLVEYKDVVTFDPAAMRYDCQACGGSFTFKEMAAGKPAASFGKQAADLSVKLRQTTLEVGATSPGKKLSGGR